MPPRRPSRSQQGARVEARRRVAERMAEAEELLGSYIAAGDRAAELSAQVRSIEADQADALARLARLVGQGMAADMAEVDGSRVRSALARKPSDGGGGPAAKDGSDSTPSAKEAAPSPR